MFGQRTGGTRSLRPRTPLIMGYSLLCLLGYQVSMVKTTRRLKVDAPYSCGPSRRLGTYCFREYEKPEGRGFGSGEAIATQCQPFSPVPHRRALFVSKP